MKLRLKQVPQFSIDMTPLTPEVCLDKSKAEIENIFLQTAGQKIKLRELFEVEKNETSDLEIIGSCEKLDYVGSTMTRGNLFVSGDTGNYTAAKLAGGIVEVRGNVGDFCGHTMKGGRITVRGNAGDFCGGASAGSINGMEGGEIFILGSVGLRCGDHIRRGLIAIRGDAKAYCGSRMKAGTIIVSGQCGINCGQGMNRGSIILRQPPVGGLADTFIAQNKHFETDFLTLLSTHLQKLDTGFEPLPLPKLAHLERIS